MTIHAAARQGGTGTTTKWTWRGERRNGPAMAGRFVTLLTQERLTPLEHVGHGGSMWLMAECAVFRDRLVVPDEGTAFFSMALKTSVVDGIAGH